MIYWEPLKASHDISETTEFIAKRAGEQVEDQAVVLLAFHALEMGHTLFPTMDSPKVDVNWSKSNLIGEEGSFKPIIKRADGRYQLHRLWYQEWFIKKWLEQSQNKSTIEIDTDFVAMLLPENDKNSPQTRAILAASSQNRVLLTGGPGTGKTFTIVRMLASMIHHFNYKKERIVLAAPTGKAASRMLESVRNSMNDLPVSDSIKKEFPEEGLTIHRLLGITSNALQTRYHETSPLPYDVVIIDEASMLDINLFFALIRALKPETRLILVGDPDQLPSVEAGAILSDLCVLSSETSATLPDQQNVAHLKNHQLGFDFSASTTLQHNLPRVHLTESRRFSDKSKIGNLAKLVNEQNAEDAWSFIQQNSSMWIPASTVSEIQLQVKKWMHNQLQELHAINSPDDGFKVFKQRMILTGHRVGPIGSEALNQMLQFEFTKQYGKNRNGFPVMITRNDYSLSVFNSDIGLYVQSGDNLRIAFESSANSYRMMNPSVLASLIQPAFAMTVHKSQGSEYRDVLLVLPQEDEHGLITKQLIYTAITRAKEQFTLIGSETVFKKAVKKLLKRESGLR